MKTVRIFILLGLLALIPAQAYAAKNVNCVNCSVSLVQALQAGVEYTQLTRLVQQYTEDLKQTANQLEMIRNQIKQYELLAQNTKGLAGDVIGEVAGAFSDLAALTRQLNSLRGDLTSLGAMFTELYPDFTSIKDLVKGANSMEAIANAAALYEHHWDKWSEEVDRATQATFQLSGFQLEALQSDAGRFQTHINKLLSSPEGQQQALMAGNQLSALQISETRQLRELIAMNIQSDLAASEKKEKESQVSREFWEDFAKPTR